MSTYFEDAAVKNDQRRELEVFIAVVTRSQAFPSTLSWVDSWGRSDASAKLRNEHPHWCETSVRAGPDETATERIRRGSRVASGRGPLRFSKLTTLYDGPSWHYLRVESG